MFLRTSLPLYSQEPCAQTSVSSLCHGRTPGSIICYSGLVFKLVLQRSDFCSQHTQHSLQRSITPVPEIQRSPCLLRHCVCVHRLPYRHSRIYLIKNKFNLKKRKSVSLSGDLGKRAQLFHGPHRVQKPTWQGSEENCFSDFTQECTPGEWSIK